MKAARCLQGQRGESTPRECLVASVHYYAWDHLGDTEGPIDTSLLQKRYTEAPAEVRRAIDRLLEQNADDRAWTEQLGAVYRQGDVAALLGKSKQAVSADHRLLRLELRGGAIGYPVFQFDGRCQLAGVADVISALSDAVMTPWTIASWLTSPNGDLDGAKPIDALRDGRAGRVVLLARRTRSSR